MMLPNQYGNLILKEDTYFKLSLFCKRFSNEESEKRYGVSHIVFACQLALPMIITPELANLIWLNFSSYLQKGETKKIDRVVISDLLLSNLFRQVSKHQIEFLPELRNYFLFLLKDNYWFGLHQIADVNESRLNGIANFLMEYLDKGASPQLSYMSSFKQLNLWAAWSYAQPEKLAYEMAKVYRKSIDSTLDKQQKEIRQLRIYMLSERFKQQIVDAKVSTGDEASRKIFMQLYSYTKANRAEILNVPEMEVNDIINEIDIGSYSSLFNDNDRILLPINNKIDSRIHRQKNRVRRVVVLLVGVGFNDSSGIEKVNLSTMKTGLELLEKNSDGRVVLEIKEIQKNITKPKFLDCLKDLFASAFPEDFVFIYFTGLGCHNAESFIYFASENESNLNLQSKNSFISSTEFKQVITDFRGNKNNLIIGMFDANINGLHSLLPENSIQICSNRGESKKDDFRYGNPAFMQTMEFVFKQFNGKITYREFIGILNAEAEILSANQGSQYQKPIILMPHTHLDMYFLSGWPKAATLFGVRQIMYCTSEKHIRILPLSFINYSSKNLQYKAKFYNEDWQDLISYPYANIKSKVKSNETISFELKKMNIVSNIEFEDLQFVEMVFGKDQLFALPEYSFFDICRLEEKNVNLSRINTSIFLNIESIEERGTQVFRLKISISQSIYFPPSNYEWFSNIIELKDSLEKFCQYHYLKHIDSSNSNNSPSNFKVDIIHSLYDENSGSRTTYNDALIVSDDWINFEDGVLRSKQLEIALANMEPFNLFFDVYIIFSNFEILKLTSGINILYQRLSEKNIRFSTGDILEKLHSPRLNAEIKVLFSRDPILIDFSQTGVVNIL